MSVLIKLQSHIFQLLSWKAVHQQRISSIKYVDMFYFRVVGCVEDFRMTVFSVPSLYIVPPPLSLYIYSACVQYTIKRSWGPERNLWERRVDM